MEKKNSFEIFKMMEVFGLETLLFKKNYVWCAIALPMPSFYEFQIMHSLSAYENEVSKCLILKIKIWKYCTLLNIWTRKASYLDQCHEHKHYSWQEKKIYTIICYALDLSWWPHILPSVQNFKAFLPPGKDLCQLHHVSGILNGMKTYPQQFRK